MFCLRSYNWILGEKSVYYGVESKELFEKKKPIELIQTSNKTIKLLYLSDLSWILCIPRGIIEICTSIV